MIRIKVLETISPKCFGDIGIGEVFQRDSHVNDWCMKIPTVLDGGGDVVDERGRKWSAVDLASGGLREIKDETLVRVGREVCLTIGVVSL